MYVHVHVHAHVQVGRLPGLSLGSSVDADTIVSDLREALVNMATTRVIDVFRAWDVDESVRPSPSFLCCCPPRHERT